MKVVETINSTFVRHNWKDVAAGVAAGKTFIVENYGVPEAVVSAPEFAAPQADVESHFARILAKPPVALAAVEISRSPEV